MNNRQPTPGKEGRVKLTFDDGSVKYAQMEMADDPLEDGTPWAKETVLTDETASIYGLDASATPNDVFKKIPQFMSGKAEAEIGKYTGTGESTNVITFRKKPFMVFLYEENPNLSENGASWLMWADGISTPTLLTSEYAFYSTTITLEENVMTIKGEADTGYPERAAIMALNNSEEKYHYIAFYFNSDLEIN